MAREAVDRLKKAGIIDTQRRRIRQDLLPDFEDDQERDFGG